MGGAKIKFPCGLEISQRGIFTGFKRLDENGILNYLVKNGCPIHGKDCKLHETTDLMKAKLGLTKIIKMLNKN